MACPQVARGMSIADRLLYHWLAEQQAESVPAPPALQVSTGVWTLGDDEKLPS